MAEENAMNRVVKLMQKINFMLLVEITNNDRIMVFFAINLLDKNPPMSFMFYGWEGFIMTVKGLHDIIIIVIVCRLASMGKSFDIKKKFSNVF